jgi:hypothetical protein
MKPYGYVRKDGEGLFIYGEHQFQNTLDAELVPVYLHPKQWVGLTDEEVYEIYTSVQEKVNEHWEKGGIAMMFPPTLYKAIEAKLKEKNSG